MTRKLQQNAADLLQAAEKLIFAIDNFTDTTVCRDALQHLRNTVGKCREPLHVDNGPVIPFPALSDNQNIVI
jgi:hypothetical protein